MKRAYGGWWFESIGKEINLNLLLGMICGVVFFEADFLAHNVLIYMVLKGLSAFGFLYFLGASLLLSKKAIDEVYKKI